MLRSVLAIRAVEQEGEGAMSKAKRGSTPTAHPGAGQRRYVVIDHESDALQTSESSLV